MTNTVLLHVIESRQDSAVAVAPALIKGARVQSPSRPNQSLHPPVGKLVVASYEGEGVPRKGWAVLERNALNSREAFATVCVAKPRKSLTHKALQGSLPLIRIETLPCLLGKTVISASTTINLPRQI